MLCQQDPRNVPSRLGVDHDECDPISPSGSQLRDRNIAPSSAVVEPIAAVAFDDGWRSGPGHAGDYETPRGAVNQTDLQTDPLAPLSVGDGLNLMSASLSDVLRSGQCAIGQDQRPKA